MKRRHGGMLRWRGGGVPAAILAVSIACAMGYAQQTAPSEITFAAHLAALRDVQTLRVRFVCEKRLALLDSPLLSGGVLAIRKAQGPVAGAVRFSTQVPYVSELILADGKVYGRSQHESEWTANNQSTRPGLSAVMLQLGGWSTGDPGKLEQFYTVTRPDRTTVPPAPRVDGPGGRGIMPPQEMVAPAGDRLNIYRLTPIDKDLAAAIKSIEIAMDQKSHALCSIQITTAQDDVTRYWFFDVELNPPLPPEIFKPGGALSAATRPAPAAREGVEGGTTGEGGRGGGR